jgi:hypothetical protein
VHYGWARRGERPAAWIGPRYKWRWVDGFVQPETGETDVWSAEHADSFTLEAILPAFAACQKGPVLLVLGQAGWPLSGRVREAMPELSITLMGLPTYSPELQPGEGLGPLGDAPPANRRVDSIDPLDATFSEQSVRRTQQRERIRSFTLYHWWPGGADHEPDS